MSDSRIIVALDYSSADSAEALYKQLDPNRCKLKVGKELFTSAGPGLVENMVGQGYDVFLDLKFHDIPNTVAKACKAAADLGVWLVNVHALGGRAMMQSAREALGSSTDRPKLIAVTILTSMKEADLNEIGLSVAVAEQVERLAKLSKDSGLDGVVCSPQEVTMLRQSIGNDFCLVTPGIRPAGSDTGDQKRIMTPAEAISAGSDYLVIGRPITQAKDPMAALTAIEQELTNL
ncbi:MAG: orotidine-5'-phosphate decarboxylase [Gammaproteobacteria bacterium]|nr:orotidine-5'-phosphate decarboxylase [Gammaproteobacteria bacterium]